MAEDDPDDPYEGLEEISDEISIQWNLDQPANFQNEGDLQS